MSPFLVGRCSFQSHDPWTQGGAKALPYGGAVSPFRRILRRCPYGGTILLCKEVP